MPFSQKLSHTGSVKFKDTNQQVIIFQYVAPPFSLPVSQLSGWHLGRSVGHSGGGTAPVCEQIRS
jgi:hypothetical protein